MASQVDQQRWSFSMDALQLSNPMEGGSRSAFFVQILLAKAEPGLIKGEGTAGIYDFLQQKCGIDRVAFAETPRLNRFIDEANRVWTSLERQFESKQAAVEAIAAILKRSRGELTYLLQAARHEISGTQRFRRLLSLIPQVRNDPAHKRANSFTRKFSKALRDPANGFLRINEATRPRSTYGLRLRKSKRSRRLN